MGLKETIRVKRGIVRVKWMTKRAFLELSVVIQ